MSQTPSVPDSDDTAHRSPSAAAATLAFATRLRLRAAALVAASMIAAVSVIAVGPAWVALPVIGAAIAATTVGVGRIASRLASPVCLTCGHDLSTEEPGDDGYLCPSCGSWSQHRTLAMLRAADAEA